MSQDPNGAIALLLNMLCYSLNCSHDRNCP